MCLLRYFKLKKTTFDLIKSSNTNDHNKNDQNDNDHSGDTY